MDVGKLRLWLDFSPVWKFIGNYLEMDESSGRGRNYFHDTEKIYWIQQQNDVIL